MQFRHAKLLFVVRLLLSKTSLQLGPTGQVLVFRCELD